MGKFLHCQEIQSSYCATKSLPLRLGIAANHQVLILRSECLKRRDERVPAQVALLENALGRYLNTGLVPGRSKTRTVSLVHCSRYSDGSKWV